MTGRTTGFVRRVLLVAALMTATVSSARAQDVPGFTAQDRRDVANANRAYDRAVAGRDEAVLQATFPVDFSAVGSDGVRRDRDATIALQTTGTAQLFDVRSEDVEIMPIDADVVLIVGRFVGRWQQGADEGTFSERYTTVWVRRGDRWVLRHEHASGSE